MMKNGILICTGTSDTKNIGDYIQSVAQEQYYNHIDCYVEREHMDSFNSDEKVKVIMNAWFMWNPLNFPPSKWIEPLCISMHIVPSIADKMLSEKTIAYLKKYEPIGARDKNTQRILQSKGIESFFSGCLTLTLGLKYKSLVKDDKIYFVDPYYEFGNTKSRFFKYINAFFLILKYKRKATIISKSFVLEQSSRLSRVSHRIDLLAHAASFYATYSTAFSDDVLLNANYITHVVVQSKFKDDDAKMEYARNLIHKYAKAKLVVTSRIHCALPCLGIETPVLFVNSEELTNGEKREGSNGRFDGLIELLNTLTWTSKGVLNPATEDKINMLNIPSNPIKYTPLRNNLIKMAQEFVDKKNTPPTGPEVSGWPPIRE